MDTDASTADSRVVEPDIKHDCDVLILEYIVWDALSSVITRARSRNARQSQSGFTDPKDASIYEATDKLRMVDSYLSLCHTSEPDFSLSPQTSFLIQLLQFSALLTLRHDRSSAVCPSPSSITSRRQANHTRAERWRQAAGNDAYPAKILNIYSSALPEIGRNTTRHGARKDNMMAGVHEGFQDGDGHQAWSVDKQTSNEQASNGNSKENSSRNSFKKHNGNINGDNDSNANGRHQRSYQAKHNQDQASAAKHEVVRDQDSDFVTLLDLLPLFMDLTATIMSTRLHDQPTPRPSSPAGTTTPDDQDKSSTTSDMVWASEPQWLELAAKFMLQAVMEQYLVLHQHGSAMPILDAFAWGKFPTVQAEPFTTDRAREAISATRSMTIPDSDEGDITALGNTPVSSPDHTPSSHPSLFVMQSEDSPASVGATWRHLRLQALSLLEPSKQFSYTAFLADVGQEQESYQRDAHVEDHLKELASHHQYEDFEMEMLEFLAHLFRSRQPPLLTQLETVYPAWMASGPPGMLSQSQATQTQSQPQPQVAVNDSQPNRRGWLAAADLTVRAGSMELMEEEVDKLMHMLSMQWFWA